jgi:chaperone modulatory protein CbpM
MATIDEIARLCKIERIELQTWIELHWVRPEETPSGPSFDEVDRARIELIRELRQDLLVDDSTLSVVLSLIDQLYCARRLLRRLDAVMRSLPEPLRSEVCSRIERIEEQ